MDTGAWWAAVLGVTESDRTARPSTNIYGAFPVDPHEVFTKSIWNEPSLDASVSPPALLESVASSQEA